MGFSRNKSEFGLATAFVQKLFDLGLDAELTDLADVVGGRPTSVDEWMIFAMLPKNRQLRFLSLTRGQYAVGVYDFDRDEDLFGERFTSYAEAERFAYKVASVAKLGAREAGRRDAKRRDRTLAREGSRLPLPNPTRGPRYTTRDAARILRDLGLHPRAYGAKELAQGMNVEREHHSVTHGDEVLIARIALDHLRERADYYRVLAKAEKAPRMNPAGTTPFVLQRAVVAIHEKNPSYSVPRVFAIATASSQRAGYLRQGTRDVTAKGRRVERGYSAEERAGLERAFEAFAVRGNPRTPSTKEFKDASRIATYFQSLFPSERNARIGVVNEPHLGQPLRLVVQTDKINLFLSKTYEGSEWDYVVEETNRSGDVLSQRGFGTYPEARQYAIDRVHTAVYGRAKALRMRPKGEYRVALPNPHDAACWVDEARSNPGDFTTPPTDRAFAAEDHLPKVREKLYAQRGSFGELRGVRLDIPSRMRDLMVVTIHEKPSGGTVVGYDHSAVVKNAEFRVAQGQQAKIMRGEAKAPHAYVSGTLVNEVPTTKGTPISFNPRTTHLFLDATNGRPVKAAKRVSIIGKRVYAEGIVYFAPGEAPKRPV